MRMFDLPTDAGVATPLVRGRRMGGGEGWAAESCFYEGKPALLIKLTYASERRAPWPLQRIDVFDTEAEREGFYGARTKE